jgi:chaperonin GroES
MSFRPTRPIPIWESIRAVNVAKLLTDEDVTAIGRIVASGYEVDMSSRSEWARRQAAANKLALQVMEEETFPWPNASSIKFPLVTVAALQFQARAYPTLLGSTEIVKCRVIGEDPTGEKTARARRISTHMSWQCLEQDEGWEEEHDKLLLVTAIAGCAFIKTGYEPGPGRIISQLVLPRNLVINYFTRTLEDSPRFTHTFNLNANAVKQREIDGRFLKFPTDASGTILEDPPGRQNPVRPDGQSGQDEITNAKDKRQGIFPPQEDDVTPWFTGEQYCWLDLDDDGYEEPYIVTFDISSGAVRRIAARFLPGDVKFDDHSTLADHQSEGHEELAYDVPRGLKVYKITPVKIFQKYGFIPSPDGGFYDLGLGSLEGPINAAVNSLINQCVDTGTLKLLGGGFLGRGFKGRGGPVTFSPSQWHVLDAAGDDIRKNVMPLPVPDISQSMFNLIGLLIQYAERIVSSTEIQMGESPGQNMKAETVRTLNQNGQRVYTGIYKRLWRAMRGEFRIRFDLNRLFLKVDQDYEDLTNGMGAGKGAMIRPDDYMGTSFDVRPAADPNVVSDEDAIRQAMLLVQLSDTHPGYNRYQAQMRLLKAQRIPNIEEVFPAPMQQDPKTGQMVPAKDFPPPPNPKLLDVQIKQKKVELEEKKLQVQLQDEVKETQAHIIEMEAHARQMLAEAKGAQLDPIIKLIYAQIEAQGKRRDHLVSMLDTMNDMAETFNDRTDQAAANAGVGGVAGQPANAAVPANARPNGGGGATPVAH